MKAFNTPSMQGYIYDELALFEGKTAFLSIPSRRMSRLIFPENFGDPSSGHPIEVVKRVPNKNAP